MVGLILILALLTSLGSLVCWVIVLMSLFSEEGVGQGILGVICGLYALIWGWQNADRLNLRLVVTVWTGLIVAGIVLNVMMRMVQ